MQLCITPINKLSGRSWRRSATSSWPAGSRTAPQSPRMSLPKSRSDNNNNNNHFRCSWQRRSQFIGVPHKNVPKEARFCGSLQQRVGSQRRGFEAARTFRTQTGPEVLHSPWTHSCPGCGCLRGLENISGPILASSKKRIRTPCTIWLRTSEHIARQTPISGLFGRTCSPRTCQDVRRWKLSLFFVTKPFKTVWRGEI